MKDNKDEENNGRGVENQYTQGVNPNLFFELDKMTPSEKLNLLEEKKTELSDLFKNNVYDAQHHAMKVIHEKSWSMRALGTLPFENIQTIEKPLFYKDYANSYKFTALYGIN